MGSGAGRPSSAEGNLNRRVLCSLIASMIGATFMKLGRAPTTLMIFISDFVAVCPEIIYPLQLQRCRPLSLSGYRCWLAAASRVEVVDPVSAWCAHPPNFARAQDDRTLPGIDQLRQFCLGICCKLGHLARRPRGS